MQGSHLGVKIGGLRLVGGPPHLPVLQDGHGIIADDGLHETAEAEDGEVEAAALQELLRARLDQHERHLGVALRIVDAEEDVALDAHGL